MLTRKDIIALALIAVAPIGLVTAAAAVNAIGPDHCDLSRDWDFDGETLIVLTCRGQLGMVRSTRIVERF